MEPEKTRLYELTVEKNGRHERTRTADPYRVKVVLYQLSYVPKGWTRSRIEVSGEMAKVTND